MENDIMSRQMADIFHQLLRSSATSKAIQLRNGEKKSAKKKRTKSQHEQAAEVQNSILLWNLISVIRKGSLTIK